MSEKKWFAAIDGTPTGPMSKSELAEAMGAGRISVETMIFGPGLDDWRPLSAVAELADLAAPRPAPPPLPGRTSAADEVDYFIHGNEMQLVEVEVDPGESAVAEAGAMMYMTPGITMETIFGDGRASAQAEGLMGKLIGAGKRLLTGESLFMTLFSNTRGRGKERVAFAAPYPGKIIPLHLAQLGGELICQKDAFLAAAKGVALELAFQKRIGVGLFGGEGFIMQRLLGDGWVFLHAGGTILERELAPGETLRMDTGCLVAMTPGVDYDIQLASGVKTAIFGGEGLFLATLTGPGHVWLQSLPLSRMADRIYQAAPSGGGGTGKDGEGGLLGGLGRLLGD